MLCLSKRHRKVEAEKVEFCCHDLTVAICGLPVRIGNSVEELSREACVLASKQQIQLVLLDSQDRWRGVSLELTVEIGRGSELVLEIWSCHLSQEISLRGGGGIVDHA